MLAMLLAAAGGGTLSADPAFLVGASGGTSRLEVRVVDPAGAPVPKAQVRLSSSVGQVGEVTSAGAGLFRATLTPPKERYPQVALILAEVDVPGQPRQLSWLAVPVHGADTAKLKTKALAEVTVTVGERTFGPLKADSSGRVSIPIVVPPGISTAQVRSVDRLGNRKDKPLALQPPPYSRLRCAATAEGASWADAAALQVECFAFQPGGAPPEKRAPVLSVDRGSLTAAEGAAALWRMTYRAPDSVSGGPAQLQAQLPGDPASTFRLSIPLKAGPATRIEVVLSAPELVAGAGGSTRVEAAPVDAKSNRLSDAPALFSASFGSLVPTADGKSAVLTVPDRFEGNTEAAVQVQAAGLTTLAKVPLKAALATEGELRFKSGQVRAGLEEALAQVTLRDRFGNAVRGEAVTAQAPSGGTAAIREAVPGQWELTFEPAREAPPGPTRVTVLGSAGAQLASSEIMVLPYQLPWGLSAGLFAGAHHNLGPAAAAGTTLELAVRPGTWPVEVLAQGGLDAFFPAAGGSGPSLSVSAQALTLAAGLRWNVPLSAGLGFHLSGVAGSQRVSSELRITEGPARDYLQQEARWQSYSKLAIGGSGRVGPGRLLIEAQLSNQPVRGQLEGNLGGVGGALGYLYELR